VVILWCVFTASLLSLFCHQVEPDDGDTEQNNTFDDKTSNVISSDDIPVAVPDLLFPNPATT